MKKISVLSLCLLFLVSFAACGVSRAEAVSGGASANTDGARDNRAKRVASDGAAVQTDDPAMPTRVIKNGTAVDMHFTNEQTGEDIIIPGILNDCETARALIKQLPYTVSVSRYSHDFCGITKELPYQESEVHYGWLNGDIDYATDAPYFTILFDDEENSEQYGYQVNIGVITCPLSEISALEGSYDVRIELASKSQ